MEHSIQHCNADSTLPIEHRTSAVTTCADFITTTICTQSTEQQPQTRSHSLSSKTASSSSSHNTAQSVVYPSSSLPSNNTHSHNKSSPSEISPSDSNINVQQHWGHTHTAAENKCIGKQYFSSGNLTHKSNAQNVCESGPICKSQKDICSRRIHTNNDNISASLQNPVSSIDDSCSHSNNNVHTPHSHLSRHSETKGSHGNNSKPLSAIPGRVSRLHHEMEQRKYGSFSSGSSSSSSGSSTYSSSPEKQPEGSLLSSSVDPPPTEIPKRTFLKDSGLPSSNNNKSTSSAIPRDISNSRTAAGSASRMRPASVSSASSAVAPGKGVKHNVVQISRSAPGSPTRAVAASPNRAAIPTARVSQLAHTRTRKPSGGRALPAGNQHHPSAGPPAELPCQQSDSRSSSLRIQPPVQVETRGQSYLQSEVLVTIKVIFNT